MKKYAAFFALVLTSLFLVSGCSEKIGRNDIYSGPLFNKDGNVVCVRGITESRYNTLDMKLGDSYREHFSVMSQTGTGEVVYSGADLAQETPVNITANPVNTQVAFGSSLRLGAMNKIVIMNLPSSPYTGAERIELSVRNVRAFDWDNTGTRIVYATTGGELRRINVDGTGDALIASEEAVLISSKHRNDIAYVGADSVLCIIDPAGIAKVSTGVTSLETLSVSKSAPSELFGRKGNTYVKVDLTNPLAPVETVVLSSFNASKPELAPSGDRIVYFDNSSAERLGIWMTDLNTKADSRVK